MPSLTTQKLQALLKDCSGDSGMEPESPEIQSWLKSIPTAPSSINWVTIASNCSAAYENYEGLAEPLGFGTLQYRENSSNHSNISTIDKYNWGSELISPIFPNLQEAGFSEDIQPSFQNICSSLPAISLGITVGFEFGFGFEGSISVICDEVGSYFFNAAAKKTGIEADAKFNLNSGWWFRPASKIECPYAGIQFALEGGVDTVVTVLADLANNEPLGITFECGSGIGGGLSFVWGNLDIFNFEKKKSNSNDYLVPHAEVL